MSGYHVYQIVIVNKISEQHQQKQQHKKVLQFDFI